MYAELEQICSKCKQAKNRKEFSARTARAKGKASWCKECLNQWRREHRKKNPQIFKDHEFVRGLRRHYKLSADKYQKMLDNQNGQCACCGKHASEFKRRLHVDHDHDTGEIRGLLCTNCNPGIGYFKDSTKLLEKAIAYLMKFKKSG